MFGTVPFFAVSLTKAGLAPHGIAFYRYLIAAVVFLPALWQARAQWRILMWGLMAGAMMGAGWIGYVEALKLAPVSTVGVIYMTYPVFTLLVGWLVFRDIPSARGLLAAAIVVVAAVLASAPAAVGAGQAKALIFALAAPLGFGLAINVLVHRLVEVAPLARVGSVSLGAMLGILPLILMSSRNEMIPADPAYWWLIVGIALGSALVPQMLYTVFAPRIGAGRTAMAGSIELPTMFAIGWFAFGEQIGVAQWLACGLIVLAIVMVPARATRNVTTNLTTDIP